MYNKTQLNIDNTFQKHVYQRDHFAHYLRWNYVLKIAKIGMNILDFGCGSGNLAEVLYRNRYKGKSYIGIDIRSKTIDSNNEKFKDVNWVHFIQHDLCEDFHTDIDFDMITCFEVLEHVGKENAEKILKNIANSANPKTTILISTPNFNGSAAKNHIIDGKVGEFEHKELQTLLEKYFTIEAKYGTFASIKDYEEKLNDWQTEMFKNLRKYYETHVLSVIMAPFFPEESRNCLWILKKNE